MGRIIKKISQKTGLDDEIIGVILYTILILATAFFIFVLVVVTLDIKKTDKYLELRSEQEVKGMKTEKEAKGINRKILLRKINEKRMGADRLPLQEDMALNFSAQEKADKLVRANVFSHRLPGPMENRVFYAEIEKYQGPLTKRRNYGEDLAVGFKNEEEVVKAWMESLVHKQVMLGEKFVKAGIGKAVYKNGGVLVVLHLSN